MNYPVSLVKNITNNKQPPTVELPSLIHKFSNDAKCCVVEAYFPAPKSNNPEKNYPNNSRYQNDVFVSAQLTTL